MITIVAVATMDFQMHDLPTPRASNRSVEEQFVDQEKLKKSLQKLFHGTSILILLKFQTVHRISTVQGESVLGSFCCFVFLVHYRFVIRFGNVFDRAFQP